MIISFIFTPCPLCGIVILFIFIIAGIKHGFKNMAKDAEAYNKRHRKQEGEKCETEMVDEGMIHLPNEKYGKKEMELYYKYKEVKDWEVMDISNYRSENGKHTAIAFHDKESDLCYANVFSGRDSTIRLIVSRSKEVLEKKIDEAYKQFDSPKS